MNPAALSEMQVSAVANLPHILISSLSLQSHKELSVLQLLSPFPHPVLIAGAYHGATIRAIHAIDPAVTIHAFEPQVACRPSLDALLDSSIPLILHPVALGTENTTAVLHGPGSDFASIVDTGRSGSEPIPMVEAGEFLRSLLTPRWSLFLLNMEGYEYRLLPHLAASGVLDSVDNLLVQYHPVAAAYPALPMLPPDWAVIWDIYPAWVWYSRTWRRTA